MAKRPLSGLLAMLPVLVLSPASGSAQTGPSVQPPGQEKTTKTTVLEAGAAAMQRDAPPDSLDIYLVGFHPLKDDPQHQFEAHHFCRQTNEDFAQCALYDGNTAEANLTGIEYIISERLFLVLPEDEKQYWHPHNGEILSGQLVAPGLPEVAEKELMRGKMNSYGKTWHTWTTGHAEGQSMPLGLPQLAWSFNRIGEANPGLIEDRDRRIDVSTEERRQSRQDLAPLANPQVGVDALNGKFGRQTEPIPGVTDAAASAAGR
jgi:hypothetical protein